MNKDFCIIDIAQVVDWKDVKRSRDYYYPTDHNNYAPVLRAIKGWKKTGFKNPPTEWLVVDGGYIYDNDLKKTKEMEQSYGISTHKKRVAHRYSLSFRPWRETANLPISQDTLNHYTLEEIMAHYLWETTFYGTEKDMAREKKKLDKICLEIKNSGGPEKMKGVPMDEVFKKIKNKTTCKKSSLPARPASSDHILFLSSSKKPTGK